MAAPTLSDCWNARSAGCFWVAEQFGYRIGSVISWSALRLRLHPNVLTVTALLAGLSGVAVACWPGVSREAGGAALVIGLLGSCCFDCADGVVARLSGRASSFGGLLDKLCDMTLSLVMCGALGVTALAWSDGPIPTHLHPAILVWSLVPKQILSLTSWLKSERENALRRPRRSPASTGWGYRAKRLAGNLTDDAPFRLGVGLSWAAGWYWEFSFVFHTAIAFVAAGYLWSSRASFQSSD